MEEEHIEKTVLAYLKRKGFKHTELAFHDEQRHHQQQHTRNSSSSSTAASQTDPDIEKCILAFSESESGPVRYHDGYSRLRSWAYSSLDLYRHELLHVLYPVFIHCFMDLVSKPYLVEARSFFTSFREDHEMIYIRDLQKLEGVLSPSHLQEMEFAHSLRHTKANVRLCQYSYELLLQYLQKTKSLTILGIINEHISFHVYPGPPGSALDTSEAVSLFGCGHETSAGQINQTEVHWGLLEETHVMEERVSAMVSEADKVDDEGKEGEPEENGKKRGSDGKKENVVVGKKVKKEKGVGGGLGKATRPETSAVSSVITNTTSSPRVKAELPLPLLSLDAEKSILDDLRNRVQLTSTALPSVSFYTFVNAYGSLNCASISQDGSMVAGGFSDSAVKVWDMARLEEDGGDSPQDENDSITLDLNGKKRPYKLLLGHSGPVYSTSFSPEGDFVLSSSSDSTVRLWSTELSANLVCYKGHNYPVWDVQYSPVGHYFASASHDRTARIWSMDRIHPLRICAGHLSDVDCVQWHVNCNYIVTGSSDKTVRMWDVQGGECVRIFVGHRGMILSLAVSPDGRYVASGDEDGMIMMWDISSGRHIAPLIGHGSCVWALSFSREGSILASGSADCTVKLWDVTTSTKAPRTVSNKMGTSNNRLRSLKSLMTKSTSVYSLCFSRRNLLFAAGPYQKVS